MDIPTALAPLHSRRLLILTLLLSGILHWCLLQWPTRATLAGEPDGDLRYSVSLNYETAARSISQLEAKVSESGVRDVANNTFTEKNEVREREAVKKDIKEQSSQIQVVEREIAEQSSASKKKVVKNRPVEKAKSESENDVVSVERPSNNKVQKQFEILKEEPDQMAAKNLVEHTSMQDALASNSDLKMDIPEQEKTINTESVATIASETSGPPPPEAQIEPAQYEIGSTNNPKPYYPSIARKRGWEGDVVLGVNVAKDGSIESLIIIKGAPYGALTHAAWETVKKEWTFQAAIQEGQAIASYIEVPISFRLTN